MVANMKLTFLLPTEEFKLTAAGPTYVVLKPDNQYTVRVRQAGSNTALRMMPNIDVYVTKQLPNNK